MLQTLFIVVVSQSSTIRRGLSDHLQKELGNAGVRGVSNIKTIVEDLGANRVDCIILDSEAGNLDLKILLKKISAIRQTPVVLFGTDMDDGFVKGLREYGVMGFVEKPEMGIKPALPGLAQLFGRTIRGISGQRSTLTDSTQKGERRKQRNKQTAASSRLAAVMANLDSIIAIGSSTGGTSALEVVLKGLPRDTPGVVIAQHMPKTFTHSFAARLDNIVSMKVREAQAGDLVQRGLILIAPGDKNMTIFLNRDKKYEIALEADRIYNRYRPSVDLLFDSVAGTAQVHAVGTILTGMGDDGARGLLKMRHAGARTLAQDEKSCVVFGMPRVAAELNAAEVVCSLENMAEKILQAVEKLGS